MVPASTSCPQRRAYSSSLPSHQWIRSGLHRAAISAIHAINLAVRTQAGWFKFRPSIMGEFNQSSSKFVRFQLLQAQAAVRVLPETGAGSARMRGCGIGNGEGVKGVSQSAGSAGGANSREQGGVMAVNHGKNNAKHA